MSVVQMDNGLTSQAKRSVDRLMTSDMSNVRKEDVMNKVNTMLNDGKYNNMTVAELKEIARQRGISRYSHSSKPVLVKALNEGWSDIPRSLEQPSAQHSYEVAHRSRENAKSRERVGQGSRERVGCGCGHNH